MHKNTPKFLFVIGLSCTKRTHLSRPRYIPAWHWHTHTDIMITILVPLA